jgi:hypothetical protein
MTLLEEGGGRESLSQVTPWENPGVSPVKRDSKGYSRHRSLIQGLSSLPDGAWVFILVSPSLLFLRWLNPSAGDRFRDGYGVWL